MSSAPGVQQRPVEEEQKVRYDSVLVPVDNSPYSNRAVERAVRIGKAFGSHIVGCHVYAARMHDYRFKQMEYTLPEEYLEEQELERQRKIHDSLIKMGLELVSDCYLEEMDEKCRQEGLECTRKMMDGKHSEELIKEIHEQNYDLVIMGALGIGKVKDSVIGAVCERVVRNSSNSDLWIIKDVPRSEVPERDTIVVGIDGSPQSFGALRTAIELARRFGKKLDLVGVYDPYLHYAVFKGIVDVLTERASKVFRFEEQNQLHEEIIDTGLAQIYQSHLNVAEAIVAEEGIPVTTTLLDGKAFQKILDHCRKTEPWLLIVGRIGIHSSESATDLGSNSENLLRLVPCDILLTTRLEYPELDLKAQQAIQWSREAEERMTRVPPQVTGIARTAILRLAVEKGHSVVTSSLVTEAMERFMPKKSAQATNRLAEKLVLERTKGQSISICRRCGVASRVENPVHCSVCGESNFEVIAPEVIEKIVASEGGSLEETTYDGRKIKWSQDARRALYQIPDKYQMRRAKARIEKKARIFHVGTITLDFARDLIDEERGTPFFPEVGIDKEDAEEQFTDHPVIAAEDPVVASDDKGNHLRSRFQWTDDAANRLFRVPAGFMRQRTQDQIEKLATERALSSIDLALVEEGIQYGRQMMEEMIKNYRREEKAEESAGLEKSIEQNGTEPNQSNRNKQDVSFSTVSNESIALNETGWLSSMARKRKNLLE